MVLSFMAPHGLIFEVAAVNCLSLGDSVYVVVMLFGQSDSVAFTCIQFVLQAVHPGASTAP